MLPHTFPLYLHTSDTFTVADEAKSGGKACNTENMAPECDPEKRVIGKKQNCNSRVGKGTRIDHKDSRKEVKGRGADRGCEEDAHGLPG